MSEDIKNIMKVASLYAAAIIGAGFASGQEILQFFTRYYNGGFYGILLAGILFSLIGCITLDKVYNEMIKNFDEFIISTAGYILGRTIDITGTFLMISMFCVMIAGSGRILSDALRIPFMIGVFAMALLCMIVLFGNIRGVVTLSAFITPLLVAGILFTGVYIIIAKSTGAFELYGHLVRITSNWAVSSILYASYNSIMSVMLMSHLLPYLKTRKVGIAGGIAGGMVLSVLACIINAAIYLFYPDGIKSELPILEIIEEYSAAIAVIYMVVLWLAMFTSAVNAGYCVVERISSRFRANKKAVTLALCAVAIPVSSFGFSGLISAVYPIFGYIGLLLMGLVISSGIKTFAAVRQKIKK